MASWKGFGKALLKGAQFVAPILSLATPAGSVAAKVGGLVTDLTDRAEEKFATGTGQEKAEFVTISTLQVLEVTTGKNYDSPEGRALIKDLLDVDVEIKQTVAAAIAPLQAKYQEKLAAVSAYIQSVQAPAANDTNAA